MSQIEATLGRRSWIVPCLAGVIGAAIMTAALGPSLVDPTNIEWLMHHDYRLHHLGWHLYRYGPWTFPLGATPLLIWPIGSSIGLTDSMPIVAIWLKALSPLLPTDFQFIGLWLVLSFALQGVFGALLMRLATPRPELQLLGATMLILSPPLIFRILHAALTAHWLILAALWLSLKQDAAQPTTRNGWAWALLLAASAATQPYIMFMIAVLLAAALVRQLLAAPRRILRITANGAIAAAAAGLSLWQSGSLMVPSEAGLEVGGFGSWSTNLLAFIMPTEGRSLFWRGPIFYAHPGQYEGYAYLGAGLLLLGVVAIVGRPFARRPVAWARLGQYIPLLLALVFLEVMALGQNVTLGTANARQVRRGLVGAADHLPNARSHGLAAVLRHRHRHSVRDQPHALPRRAGAVRAGRHRPDGGRCWNDALRPRHARVGIPQSAAERVLVTACRSTTSSWCSCRPTSASAAVISTTRRSRCSPAVTALESTRG